MPAKVVTKTKPKPKPREKVKAKSVSRKVKVEEKPKSVTEEMEVMKPDWLKKNVRKYNYDPNALKMAPIGPVKEPMFPAVLIPMSDKDTMEMMNKMIDSTMRAGDDPLKMFADMYGLFFHKDEGYYTISRPGSFKMSFRGHFSEYKN